MALKVIKTPEELRQEDRERLQKLAMQYAELKKTMIQRWVGGAILIAALASFFNYMEVNPCWLAHMAFSGMASYLLLTNNRGHISGILVLGTGNIIISFIYMHYHPHGGFPFNPFGLVAYCILGGLIGIGIRLDSDPR